MTTSRFRCAIVGEGTLPIVCSQILLDRGHRVLALISPDPGVLDWAANNAIPNARQPSKLMNLLQGAPMDCLFSAVNFQKLPGSLLAAARCHAVNYHDGPLPRYAGMHATSWALINDESDYAVTWHLMTRRSDAGDILSQVPVAIDPDETALSLNAKCYEAAVAGFRAMLQDMEAGTLARRPQDLGERSWFGRHRRPAAGCTLRFDAPAERMHALLRALDFGPYPNPLGLPKIVLAESFVIVTELDVLDRRSDAAPGTVMAIGDDCMVVATATEDVELAGFHTLQGLPLDVADVVDLGRLHVGGCIVPLEAARANRLEVLDEICARHEAFWVGELAGADPLRLPFAHRAPGSTPRIGRRVAPLAGTMHAMDAPGATGRDGVRLLAAFLRELARLSGRDGVDVGYSDSRLHARIGDLDGYFASCLPLRMTVEREERFDSFAEAVGARLELLRGHVSHARDAPLREPSLRARLDALDTTNWPVALELLDDLDDPPVCPLPGGRVLVARFRTDGREFALLRDPDVIGPGQIAGIVAGVEASLATLATLGGDARNRQASTDPTSAWRA